MVCGGILSLSNTFHQLNTLSNSEPFLYIFVGNFFLTINLGIFLFLRKQYLLRTEPKKLVRIYRTIEPIFLTFAIGNFIYSIVMTVSVVALALKVK